MAHNFSLGSTQFFRYLALFPNLTLYVYWCPTVRVLMSYCTCTDVLLYMCRCPTVRVLMSYCTCTDVLLYVYWCPTVCVPMSYCACTVRVPMSYCTSEHNHVYLLALSLVWSQHVPECQLSKEPPQHPASRHSCHPWKEWYTTKQCKGQVLPIMNTTIGGYFYFITLPSITIEMEHKQGSPGNTNVCVNWLVLDHRYSQQMFSILSCQSHRHVGTTRVHVTSCKQNEEGTSTPLAKILSW